MNQWSGAVQGVLSWRHSRHAVVGSSSMTATDSGQDWMGSTRQEIAPTVVCKAFVRA